MIILADDHPFDNVSCDRSTTNIHKSSSPTMKDVKPSLIRRVTSKLRITVPATTSSSQPVSTVARSSHSPSEAKDSSRPPRSPRVTLHHSPTLPNSFVSREKREAALRERGLRPPRKDLSEQEREADERLGLAPLPVPEQGECGSSAAAKIKEEWLFMNRSIESGVSDHGPAFYPRQPNFSLVSGVALSHVSKSTPRGSSCDSDYIDTELKPDILGRSSISSSVPPLSQSSHTSHLEVLQEEPAEHVPPTSPHPRAQPPIVISTPVEDSFPPIVESPVSCAFSSHLAPPGSQPHSPLPAPSDKENSHSPFPALPVRRRTTNSSNRSHSPVGTTLSRFGTNSLTNLRRSVIGSIRHTGSSADLSTSSSQRSSPRMAVSPTMHNRGSIVFEAKGIEDAESRRLCELAFLD
jgi:hypothetical protein